MSAQDDGGSAFPQVGSEQVGSHGEYHTEVSSYGGMTLRDYFAAKVLQSAMTQAGIRGIPITELAQSVWKVADAMIAARSRDRGR